MEYIIIWVGLFLIGAFGLVLVVGVIDVVMRAYKDKKLEKLNKKYLSEEIVSCQICNCLLYRKDAYEIISFDKFNKYYCLKDKPNYEGVKNGKYLKVMEVDLDGEPIGYKKIK